MNQSISLSKSFMSQPPLDLTKKRSLSHSKAVVGKVMVSVDEQTDPLPSQERSILWSTSEGAAIGRSRQIKLNRISKLFKAANPNDLYITNSAKYASPPPKTSHNPLRPRVGGGFQNLQHSSLSKPNPDSLSETQLLSHSQHPSSPLNAPTHKSFLGPKRKLTVGSTNLHALSQRSDLLHSNPSQTTRPGVTSSRGEKISQRQLYVQITELLEKEKGLKEKNAKLEAENQKQSIELDEMKATNKLLAEQRLQEGTLQNVDMERISVHSLYQDLFLTDLKKEVVEANNEALMRNGEVAELRKEVATLKKIIKELHSKLRFYRTLLMQHEATSPKKVRPGHRLSSRLSEMTPQIQEEVVKVDAIRGLSTVETEYEGRAVRDSISEDQSPQLFFRSPSRLTQGHGKDGLDILQLEMMINSLKRMSRCQKVGNLITMTLEEIRTFMNCSRAMIFFMDPVVARRFNLDIPGITQTVQIEKEWIEVVLPSWLNSQAVNINPGFKNRSELRSGVSGKQIMSMPVSFSNYNRLTRDVETSLRQIHFAVQLEGRLTRSGGPSAFKIQDEMVISLLCTFLSSTIERIISKQNLETERTRQMAVLGCCRDLACIRDHRQLFRQLKQRLPGLLGFQRAGILLTHQKTQEFYIINQEIGIDGVPYASHTIQVPSKIGITGIASETQQLQVVLDGKSDPRYSTDVDNLTGHSDIRNLLILPLLSQDKKIVGMAQLINKVDAEFPDVFIQTVEFLGPILGALISNTNEHVNVCNVSIALHQCLDTITAVFKDRTNWLASLSQAAYAQQMNQNMQKVHLLLNELIRSKKMQYFKQRAVVV